MTKDYELTESEYAELMTASQPVPYLVMHGTAPRSPQEKAEAVWAGIAERRGLVFDSIVPSPLGERCFRATLRPGR